MPAGLSERLIGKPTKPAGPLIRLGWLRSLQKLRLGMSPTQRLR